MTLPKISLTQWILIIITVAIVGPGALDFLRSANPAGDWMMFVRASRRYLNSVPIYHVLIRQQEYSNFFLYSPFFALILVPVSFLPLDLSIILWHLLKIFLLYRVFQITAGFCGYNELTEKQKTIVLLGSTLFSLRFLLYDFNLGQITVFLLWVMMEGWYQLTRRRILLAAFLLALGIFIKMLPIIFVPYLIYKKQFRALLYLFLWIIVMAFIPFITGRWDYNFHLLHEWIDIIQPMAVSRGDYNASSLVMHDLFTAVPAWYAAIAEWLHHASDFTSGQLRLITYFLILCFAAGFLFLSRFNSYRTQDSMKSEFLECIYLIGCIPVIFPYQHKYSYVLMVPLIIYLMIKFAAGRSKLYERIMMFMAFLLMVISTDGIIGHSLNVITQELKFVTLGGILLLLILLFEPIKAVPRV